MGFLIEVYPVIFTSTFQTLKCEKGPLLPVFAYLQRGAENPYAVQSIICGGVIAAFDEGASELLFGGRPLLAES